MMVTGILLYIKKPWKPENPDTKWLEPLPMDTLLSAESVAIDRDDAIKFIEDAHPFFVDGSDQAGYFEAKEAYINSTQTEMTVRDFMIATSKYYCFFKDGHTAIWWSEDEFLDIDVHYENGNYYKITDENNGSKVYITKIDGVQIDEIYEAIEAVKPVENEMARVSNREALFGAKGILEIAGVDTSKEKITVEYSDGTSVEASFRKAARGFSTEEPNSIFLDGDVVVIDFNICNDDKELKKICKQLEKYIDNGYDKVIIDARSNPGGSSNACERLLETMGMRSPSYGVFIRYSEEAKAQRSYARSSGDSYASAPLLDGKANDKIKLVVLCDKDTYSSATMLLVYVRDAKLGTIIGEPSSNKPNSYGDILYNSLSNSHITSTVSHKKFVRPDADNNENMLIPDIETKPEDAYKTALEYLHQK